MKPVPSIGIRIERYYGLADTRNGNKLVIYTFSREANNWLIGQMDNYGTWSAFISPIWENKVQNFNEFTFYNHRRYDIEQCAQYFLSYDTMEGE